MQVLRTGHGLVEVLNVKSRRLPDGFEHGCEAKRDAKDSSQVNGKKNEISVKQRPSFDKYSSDIQKSAWKRLVFYLH